MLIERLVSLLQVGTPLPTPKHQHFLDSGISLLEISHVERCMMRQDCDGRLGCFSPTQLQDLL